MSKSRTELYTLPRSKPKTCKDESHLRAIQTLREINQTVADGILLLSHAQMLLLDALVFTRDVQGEEKAEWEKKVRELLGSELSKGV